MTRAPEAPRGLPLAPALVLMAGRLPGFAATFLIPVVLVRVFDQSTFGTYKQIFLLVSTLGLMAQCGMAESLAYFIPADPGRRGRYVANALLFLGSAGAAALLLVSAGSGRIAAWLGNPALEEHLPIVAVILALQLASSALEIALLARARYGEAALSWALSDVGRTLLFALPALATGSLRWLLVGGVIHGAARLAAAVVRLARAFPDLVPDRALLGRQLAYALPFAAAFLVDALQANLHHYVVSARFGAAVFAVYAVGCLQVPLVDFVAGPAGNVLMVRIGERLAAGDRAAPLLLWRDACRTLAVVFVPLVALLLVIARPLFALLFTEAYAAGVPLFMAWVTSILFAALPTDAVLRSFAKTRALLLVNGARLLVVAVAIGPLLGWWGPIGGIVATLLAAAAGKALHLVLIRRLLRAPWGALLPLDPAVICAAAGAAAPAALLVAASPPAAGVAAGAVVYVAVYGAALLLLSPDARRASSSWLAWRRAARLGAGVD